MGKTGKKEISAEVVNSIDDLLLQILLGLPIRTLLRFKSVSKHWHSLISSPAFAILRHCSLRAASGLILHSQCLPRIPNFEYVNFDTHDLISPPFSLLDSTETVNIVQSCNGLFLCSSTQGKCSLVKYHIVFNPTTNQWRAISKPSRRAIHGIALAFDLAKSPAYKVVCILNSDSVPGAYQLKIYSSETGSWRVSGEPFKANHDFKNGVFWNGAIIWLCKSSEEEIFYYNKISFFNVDEERLGEMPGPYPSNLDGGSNVSYFGEANGHLHLFDIYGSADYELEIHEMERDYSGWFVKYRIQLAGLGGAFPSLDRNDLRPWNIGCVLSMIAVMRGEKEEDEFVVLQIPGKAIRYDVVAGTYHKLCDFVDGVMDEAKGRLRFPDLSAHQFFESLTPV